VNSLLTGFLAALVATNQPTMVSNLVTQATGVSVSVPDPKDPVEKEFQKVMDLDDATQTEVDKWLRDNSEFASKGAGISREEAKRHVLERLEPVDKAYQDFIKKHPDHARARVAYASFLGDTKGEDAAEEQLEKALALDTNNPAIYNNLANIYGHTGPVKKAFEFYAKAIQLNPIEPVYYHNLGTTVYLFRKDAREFYNIDEDQVFAKAFQFYSNAMRLDPQNFPLASDVAQTYYGIKPLRIEEALKAWTNALNIARDEVEREGVYIHFARINLNGGRLDLASAFLNAVTNDMYADLKKRIARNLDEKQKKSANTNEPPQAAAEKK
jgi:tetratricopeptide (TPR) repeat protein